jgi:hypothetical protein
MLEKAKALCSGSGTQESPDAAQLLEKALTMKENGQYSEAAAVLQEAKASLTESMNGQANSDGNRSEILHLLEVGRQHKKNKDYHRCIEFLEQAKRKIA